jgi:hypothetical protein
MIMRGRSAAADRRLRRPTDTPGLRLHLQSPPKIGYFEVVNRAVLARVGDVAADQWGLITRRQAAAAGVASTTMDRLTAPGSALERVASGVYRLTGAPIPDHADLRAAWLQLAPETPAWQRRPEQGVVSDRSAAAVYGVGHLVADVHEFTLPHRRQTRRPDVRLHIRSLGDAEWIALRGLPVTLPSRIAADLLREREDPEAVAQIITDSIRHVFDYPASFAQTLAPHAARFGFPSGDGLSLLRWFLSLVGDAETDLWMEQAARTLSDADRASSSTGTRR